jgi:molecular chaperone GrpE (heat shock protein)
VTIAARELAARVHELMRRQADLLDELDRVTRDARKQRDGLLREVLEVMDGAQRAEERVHDPEARDVFRAIAEQVELIFVGAGLATFTFEAGVVPPLGEIDVVGTVSDPTLADLAVVRTVHAGLRDNQRIIRKAAVEINRLEPREET